MEVLGCIESFSAGFLSAPKTGKTRQEILRGLVALLRAMAKARGTRMGPDGARALQVSNITMCGLYKIMIINT